MQDTVAAADIEVQGKGTVNSAKMDPEAKKRIRRDGGWFAQQKMIQGWDTLNSLRWAGCSRVSYSFILLVVILYLLFTISYFI